MSNNLAENLFIITAPSGAGKTTLIKNVIEFAQINDEKVFSLLSTGETTGLFQLESAGMREAIKQMKPNRFDDIIALVAL